MSFKAVLWSLLILPGAGAFADLTPRDALRFAFSHRGAVQGAKEQLAQAIHEGQAMGAYPLTRIETGASTIPDVSGGEDLTLFQPLDVFGKSRAQAAMGRAAIKAARATYRQALLDVQSDILGAFAQFCNAQRLLESAQAQTEIAQRTYLATQKRVEAEALPALQLLRAELETDRTRQLVDDRKAALEAARARLFAALGTRDAVADPQTADFAPDWITPVSLAISRPDLLSIQSELDSAQAEARQARLSSLPDLEIQARRSPWSAGSPTYAARFQFVVPIWDHGVARNRTDAAELHTRAAEALLRDRLLRAEAEQKANNLELQAAVRSVGVYAKLVASSQTLLDKTQRGFELGASSLLDVLDARRALADSQDLLTGAQLRRDQAVVDVLTTQGQLLEEPK